MISRIPPPARIHRVVLIFVIVCLLATCAGAILVTAQKDDNRQPSLATDQTTVRSRIAERFGQLPLSFEINKGQVDRSVKFLSHGNGYDLFLTSTEAVLRVAKTSDADENVREGTVLRLRMLGANGTPKVEGQEELPGKVNYFIGNDPENWYRNVPTYKKVHFKDVYPGIDVVYYGNQRELEYDFVVAPGANPKLIRFAVEGADQTRLDKNGRLRLVLKHGEVFLNQPVIYQLDNNGSRSEIKGAYVISGNEIKFKLERFDSSKPLIIDPVLSYSTMLGSGQNDSAAGIAVDSQGSAYVTGTTDATTFPTTPGSFRSTTTRGGAFVTKLDPTGSTLIYSTYLNGAEGTTNGFGIAVDSAGNAHVTGSTSATDWPIVNGLKTTSNFFKTTNAAASWSNQNSGIVGSVITIAVAPSTPNTIYAVGSGFHRSTDGGATWTKTPATGLSSSTQANAMAVDPANASVVYVGNFSGLFKSTDGGNNWSSITQAPLGFQSINAIAFDPSTPSTLYVGAASGVFKSTDSGSTWIAQNNFGIPGTPAVRALAVDPSTPLTIYAGTFNNGLFKSTNGGGVWTAMNDGMGGSNPLNVSAIVVDPVTPSTVYTGHGSSFSGGAINKSTNGGTSWAPLTNGVPNGGVMAMVATSSGVFAAFNGAGVIKTTNGGSNWTNVDTGLWSPVVNTLVKHPTDPAVLYVGTHGSGQSDAFVTKLNSAGSGLLFSTLLGGSREETGNGIAVDGNGNISVVGETKSLNFPFANAVRSTVTFSGNCGTGFVTKFNPAVPSYVFSTYLGGGECDRAHGVATDGSGNVYVTGRTGSPDFPTANALQPNFAGPSFNSDAFVTKLTSNGALTFSTYLGGASGSDTGFGIAADSSGNAYVTGHTDSTNFPTLNPIQPGTPADAFVTKISSGGALVYSTYLGGSGFEEGRGIAVDSANNVYVTGSSQSGDFPLMAGALRTRSAMYKSVDGAASWSNDNYGFASVTVPFSGFSSVTALAIHPTETSIIYAATSRGVFKSTNGGRTWFLSNNGLPTAVFGLVINPSTPSTLYAAISGTPSDEGVYKSTDSGATWIKRSNGIVSQEIHSLALDPVEPNTLYVGVSFCCGGSNSRIFKTTDGADNWAPVGTQPPQVPMTLAVDPLNHTTIYTSDAATPGGVYKSTDGGATWPSVGPGVSFARSIAVSPHTSGVVYAGTDQGVFKSTNGGTSWTLSNPRPGGKIVFDPVSSSTVYLLTNPFDFNPSGLFKSTDNGQTWVQMNKGLNTPSAVALVIDPHRPSTLYLASTVASGSEAFVVKINPAGSAMIYSTLLGGSFNPSFSNVNAQGLGIALDSSGNAYVAGMTTAPGFLVTPNSYQPFNRGSNDAFISKLTMSYLISGQVLNNGVTPMGGVEVVLNDGTSLTSVLTEGDGSYQFSRLREGGNFTVSANMPHFTMTPASQTFNNLNSDQVLNFNAVTSNSSFFIVSGQITENLVPLAGVTVTLSGSQSGVRTTDSNGNYSFELITNGNYTVTPSLVGFNFGPTSQTFNNLIANQTANFAATRQSFVVTNANNHGAGSLRDAITNANATFGADTIVFNIPGAGVKTINLMNALPEITDPVVIDATTQPGYAGTPLIEIDGLALGGNVNGLVIKAGGTTVRGLSIGNFRFDGGRAIWLNACNNNVIQGNYIGVAADGTTARQNGRGIVLTNSSNNVIGGTTAATRNVISSSQSDGISIDGSGNVIQGNYIGTNAAGTAALSNAIGVSIFNSTFVNNLIGGTAAGAGNLISGNQTGVLTNGTGTTIQGNLVGTNAAGTNKIPNTTSGIQATGLNILVGGVTPGARNVISGNQNQGVYIRGAGNKLQGNFIGTDITGTLALGNTGTGVIAGETALVGGTAPEARNIISANSGSGNVALGLNSSGNAATVQGNFIGTDVTGTRALGGGAGINIFTNDHIIGGLAAGTRNVISGNSIGIQVSGFSSGAVGNVIQGNFIGLNAAGTGPLPNTQQGILLSPAVNNTIGGTQSEAGNKIAFNGGGGVVVTNGTGNAIRGNSIFSNNGLGIDLGSNGVTANDGNDGDSGPNHLQNFPVVSGVLSSSNSTTIQGSLKSFPNTTFQIDFFSNSAVDPSGNGEGAQFFGTTSVNTDGNGDATINATFPIGLAAGRVITATATDPNGNTSEFSAADSTTTAGSVHFSVSSMQLIEDIGTLTVNVQRTGGTAGSLTVDYSTVDGTALAGQDYTATSGTLTFSGGETSKTIQIPITNDSTTETTNETFTVALSNTSSLEALGAPSVLTVTLLDRSTTPLLSVANLFVNEGNAGSTTDALFTITLSAATGRAVTGNFATSNVSASGGATCSTQGVDYETKSGTFSFTPGTTTFTIPLKICGDTSAEADENFRVLFSNVSGAVPPFSQVFVTIVNDDVLELILEESGPDPTQAAALDAILALRDPFSVVGIPDWFPTGPDKNTRIALIARNLQLNPGELPSNVSVRFTPNNGGLIFEVPAESVRPIANSEFTQVVVRLPNNLAPGTCTVFIRAHTRISNTGTIRIAP